MKDIYCFSWYIFENHSSIFCNLHRKRFLFSIFKIAKFISMSVYDIIIIITGKTSYLIY